MLNRASFPYRQFFTFEGFKFNFKSSFSLQIVTLGDRLLIYSTSLVTLE